RAGGEGLSGGAVLRRNLQRAIHFLDVAEIVVCAEAAASAVRRPLMLNEAAGGDDGQYSVHGRASHRLRRRAMLRIGSIIVLRPHAVYHETIVALGIALAGGGVAGMSSA